MNTIELSDIRSEYLIRANITPGSFSTEYIVSFPCYDKQGELTEKSIALYESNVALKEGLSRIDLIDIRNQIAEIEMHNHSGVERFRVPLELLVRNTGYEFYS